MIVKRMLALAVFLIAMPVMAWGAKDDISVRSYVDRKTIFIGDVIKYTLEVKADKSTELSFPDFKDGKIDEFEIKDVYAAVTKSFFGKNTVTKSYRITCYSTGLQIIPAVEIKYKNKLSADWSTRKSPSINIRVESVLPKNQNVKDIRDIKGPMLFFTVPWFMVFLLILILAAAFVSFRVYRKIKEKAALKLPYELALEALEALRAGLAEGGGLKDYYVGVSDCIRHYIETVFKLKAPEMTTEEFLNSLKDSRSLSAEQKGLLKIFLNACDMVKFAKYTPTRVETESVYSSAKRFVEETKHLCLPLKTPGS